MKLLIRKYCLLFVFATVIVSINNGDEVIFDASIDWQSGTIAMTASTLLEDSSQPLPKRREKAQKEIEINLAALFRNYLSAIYFDSSSTLGQRFGASEQIQSNYVRYLDSASKVSGSLSADLRQLRSQYTATIYPDLIDLFYRRTIPRPIEQLLSYQPTTDYSGIVIYVANQLPLYGENDTGQLELCLFPKIYYGSGQLLFSYEMMEPEWIRRWGNVSYTYSTNSLSHQHRVGENPLYTQAVAIFGSNRTDPVINENAAGMILTSAHNIELLRQGKILVVIER